MILPQLQQHQNVKRISHRPKCSGAANDGHLSLLLQSLYSVTSRCSIDYLVGVHDCTTVTVRVLSSPPSLCRRRGAAAAEEQLMRAEQEETSRPQRRFIEAYRLVNVTKRCRGAPQVGAAPSLQDDKLLQLDDRKYLPNYKLNLNKQLACTRVVSSTQFH